eukprot:1150094-Pelagomonas_calceolata.AAC.1
MQASGACVCAYVRVCLCLADIPLPVCITASCASLCTVIPPPVCITARSWVAREDLPRLHFRLYQLCLTVHCHSPACLHNHEVMGRQRGSASVVFCSVSAVPRCAL